MNWNSPTMAERVLYVNIHHDIEEIVSPYVYEIMDRITLSNIASDIIQYLEPYRHYGSIYNFSVDYSMNESDGNTFPFVDVWIKTSPSGEYRRIQCMMRSHDSDINKNKPIKIELRDELFQI